MNTNAIETKETNETGETAMRTRMITVLGSLVLVLELAGSASASSFVDVTYDLADTILVNTAAPTCPDVNSVCLITDVLGGSMKIRYASNSATSMPILHGPVTLQSLALSAKATIAGATGFSTQPFSTANVNFNLVSSVTGSLLSGGTLTFGGVQIRATGTRHCQAVTGGPVTQFCIALLAQLTSVPGALGPYTATGTFSFAASAGPYGGAQSTRHTLSGTIPAYAPSKISNIDSRMLFATAASLLGREVLREAPGHDPKVIPEPGTLLLLGAGTAGLALVGRATRRSRQG